MSPGIKKVTGFTPEEWKTLHDSRITDHPINLKVPEYIRTALGTGQKLPAAPGPIKTCTKTNKAERENRSRFEAQGTKDEERGNRRLSMTYYAFINFEH